MAGHAVRTEATRRASQTLEWGESQYSLLDVALDHLTLARTGLYRSILESPDGDLREPSAEMDRALNGLRQASAINELLKALLTASLLTMMQARSVGPVPTGHSHAVDAHRSGRWEPALRDKSLAYLSEAQQIAERGPMPLFLADVHLHRARLLGMVTGEEQRAKDELSAARRLIEKHNYGRRREELADAEQWLAGGDADS